MRVLIVNTSEQAGGAAVAAKRLKDALNNNGVKAKMLVRDRVEQADAPGAPATDDITVASLRHPGLARRHFLWERLCLFLHLRCSRRNLFAIDMANAGADITTLREFREADIVHLHWVNQGMLSLQGIRRILQSGKPVVWTMHDMWPATALCHLTMGCRHFTTGCHNCRYLPSGGAANDLSARVWKRKKRMLQGQSMTFVACSRWLEGEAKASALLRGQTVTSIPNPIDTRLFCPGNQLEARRTEQLPEKKRLILCVCQRLDNPYKGMTYFVEACQTLARQHPKMCLDTGVVLLGSHADELAGTLPFKAYPLGYVTDARRICRIYRAADVFVLPSLSENLPNTIMEAMACGVPCVAFRVGGIPEEIDHQRNGYVAEYRSQEDLANGIYWTLHQADRQKLGEEAVRKVAQNYSYSAVAMHYTEVYQAAMAQKHFKL